MIRVRFAPSPTGYLHIGGLRTALYNYIYARQHSGKLILRIEDTDRARMVDGAVENLISTLKWSGIEFDEGPHKGGDFGPYTQSERLDVYKEHVHKLIDNGNAYPCFYSHERTNSIKSKNIPSDIVAEYDRRYRDLPLSEMYERMNDENHVIRLKVPSDGTVEIRDQIRGDIKFDLNLIQDQIIIKSDGYPTYHLASVVDDHLMQISHVIRGEEWIPSLPKHYLLYKSLAWDQPEFIHLPLLLNKDKTKLSKRQGDVAVEDYIKNGYLKDALINFVSLLGWHGADDKEIYNADELIECFSIDRIRSSGAVFDLKKLTWFNNQYIKNHDTLSLKKLIDDSISQKWDIDPRMIDLVKESAETINAFEEKLQPFFMYSSPLINDDNKLFSKEIYKFLSILQSEITNKNIITSEEFKLTINQIKEAQQTTGNIWKPIRIAITGSEHGPDISKFVEILGPEQCCRRLKLFLQKNDN